MTAEGIVFDERSAKERVIGQLLEHGVSRTKAIELVSRFKLRDIERQIGWLPYRAARSKASILIAAIEHDYDAPSLWQAQQNPKE